MIPGYERFDEISRGVPGHDTFGTQQKKRNKIFFFVGLAFVFCLLAGSTVLIGEFLKDYPTPDNNWNGSPDLFRNVDRGNTIGKTRRAVPENDHVSDPTVYNVSDPTVYNVSDPTVYNLTDPTVYNVSDPTVYNVSDPTVYNLTDPIYNLTDPTTPSYETTCITGIIKTIFCLSYRQVYKAYNNCFGIKNATYYKDYMNFDKIRIIYPGNVTDYWCD